MAESASTTGVLSGIVCVVTGSSRGIGRETVRLLLELGAAVVVNGRDAGRVEETTAALATQYGEHRVLGIAEDITQAEPAHRLIDRTIERFGRIDLLINNAGISMRGPVAELSAATVESMVRVNTVGAVFPTVAALPYLRAGKGSVLFISTIAALWGFPGVSMYSASKMAVTAFAQALAAEEARNGLHVGVVYLGFTENDPDKSILSADGRSFHHARRAQHTQADAAAAIVGAYRNRRAETITAPAGRWLARAARLLPRVVRALLARSGGRIHSVTPDDTP